MGTEPGVASRTAGRLFLTLTPVAVSGLSRLVGDPAVPTFALRAGVAGGMAVSAGLVPALKSRLRRRG
jgi:hypothetical protein